MELFTILQFEQIQELGLTRPSIRGTFDKEEDAVNAMNAIKQRIDAKDDTGNAFGCWVEDGPYKSYRLPSYHTIKVNGRILFDLFHSMGCDPKCNSIEMVAYQKLEILCYPLNIPVNKTFSPCSESAIQRKDVRRY